VSDDALNVQHGDRVYAGERLIEQHELRFRGERTGDFDATSFAAREALTDAVANMADMQLLEQ
jgi:hypothetical protein